MKLIDLSITIENEVPSDPQEMIPVINYLDHEKLYLICCAFGNGKKGRICLMAKAWAMESVRLTTHAALSYMDAPYHYHPTMDDGQPTWTIEEVPLDWVLWGEGVMLDFQINQMAVYQLTVTDFQHA